MSKEDLIKKINDFLDDESLLSSDEDVFWREKIKTLPEEELMDLLPLLKEKNALLKETGEFLFKVLDQVSLDQEELRKIPNKVSLVGKPLRDIANIFRDDLLKWLTDPEVDVLEQLAKHYNQQVKMGKEGFNFSLVARNAFDNNQELFTNNEALEDITIGQWLRSYQASNNKKKRGGLDRLNFVNQNENAKKLKETERPILLKLLKIFDFLQDPSVEENKGEISKVPAGPIAPPVNIDRVDLGASQPKVEQPISEKIVPEAAAPATPTATVPVTATAKYSKEDILQKYQENQAEVDQIASYAVDKQNQYSNNLAAIHQALYQEVIAVEPDRREVLSLIYLLSKLGSLGTILKSNDSMAKLFQDYLQYQKQTQLLDDFKLHPGDPKFVSWLLSYILQDKLKMTENESASFGLRLHNLSKQAGDEQFGQLAYFDMDSGMFRWKK